MFIIERKESYVTKTFRLPASLLERAEAAADDNNVSLNELVRQALEYALADMRGKSNG